MGCATAEGPEGVAGGRTAAGVRVPPIGPKGVCAIDAPSLAVAGGIAPAKVLGAPAAAAVLATAGGGAPLNESEEA